MSSQGDINNIDNCKTCGEMYTDLTYKWCKPCQINYLKNDFTKWTSENKEIDDFVQKTQLMISKWHDIVFEWIPYNQFYSIKEMNEGNFVTVYSAVWKDGPLNYDKDKKELKRLSDEKVALYNSKNNIDEFLNEVKAYSINCDGILGISQNSVTKDYVIVFQYYNLNNNFCEKCGERCTNLNCELCKSCQMNYLKSDFTNWTSGNDEIDGFINRETHGIVFEWIPYNQFNNIKEISKSDYATIYSAVWKDSWLSSVKVILKCLYNSQNIINEFLNEVKSYSIIYDGIIGVSQNSDTKDYIIVFQHYDFCEKCGEYKIFLNYEWCKTCQINYLKDNFTNWTSGNEKIDDFIKEMQLKINEWYDIIFEWIPYNQFYNIKEIDTRIKSDFVKVYSAIWKDGPLNYDIDKKELERLSNNKVALKCLHNTQNIDNFLNEIKIHDNSKIYGISQNPDTKDYIIVHII